MLETRADIIERIGQALHRAYEEMVHEPTPERWIELINRLNEEEVVQRVKSMGDDSSR
jgi:anti-sigma factor NepR-like protein